MRVFGFSVVVSILHGSGTEREPKMFQFKAWGIQWFWETLSFSWRWLLFSYLCFLHWLRWLSVNKAGDDEQEKSCDWHHGTAPPFFSLSNRLTGLFFFIINLFINSAPCEEQKTPADGPAFRWFIHTPVLLFKMPAHQPNKIQVSSADWLCPIPTHRRCGSTGHRRKSR